MVTFSRSVLGLSFLLLVVPMLACGEAGGGVDAEGAVTYDNAPVEKGMIKFIPTQGQQICFVEFTGGRYEMKGELSPQPGAYQVEIEGFKKVKEPRAPDYIKDENGMIEKQFLPEKYNKKSTLTVEIKEGQSDYPFNLEK